jgi:hypothetical protein
MIIWTIFLLIGRIISKFIAKKLKFFIKKIPVFQRQEKKEKIRQLNLQG